jgi:hypothetical protein
MSWKKADRTAGRHVTWVEDPVSTTALWWERNVRLGQEGGRLLGPELYYEIRYEDLVADARRECMKLCAFLGVAFDERMLRFHEGRIRTDPSLDAKKAWRPVTSGLRNWASEMDPEDVERFEAVAGDLLDELGYERATPEPSAEASERAARVRQSFSREVERRSHRRLPRRWPS